MFIVVKKFLFRMKTTSVKKNKGFILLGFIILFSLNGSCQYSIAGTLCVINTDVVPDTLLNAPNNGGSETYKVDINQDGIDDIQFTSQSTSSPGGQARSVSVSTLSPSIKLSLGSIDSTYNFSFNYWITRRILKKHSNQDTIKASNFTPSTSGNLGYYYFTAGTASSSPQWVGAVDKYIGVSITDSVSISYGWIKVDVPGTALCIVKEHSLCYSNSISLFDNRDTHELYFYPNPTSDFIYINTDEKPVIYDCTGKNVIIEVQTIKTGMYLIDCRKLNAGIYLIQGNTKGNTIRKKFLIEK